MKNTVLQFILSSALSCLVLTLILPFLQKSMVDIPSSRSSHREPTPRGGGISFVIIGSLLNFILASGIIKWIPIMCIPLAVIGFMDDYKSQPVVLRYFVQVVTAIGLVLVSSLQFTPYTFVIVVIVVSAIINFTNFMDGLDGLVAGCGVMMLASTSSWSISGAIFGFLFFNWSPARVFMGDVGSTFIGAVFCGMVLQSDSYSEAISRLFISFPLLIDALQCLLRRSLAGANIFKPHRQHLFQRLHQSGLSHAKVALLYIIATGFLLTAYFFREVLALSLIACIILIFGFLLEWKVAKPFSP